MYPSPSSLVLSFISRPFFHLFDLAFHFSAFFRFFPLNERVRIERKSRFSKRDFLHFQPSADTLTPSFIHLEMSPSRPRMRTEPPSAYDSSLSGTLSSIRFGGKVGGDRRTSNSQRSAVGLSRKLSSSAGIARRHSEEEEGTRRFDRQN